MSAGGKIVWQAHSSSVFAQANARSIGGDLTIQGQSAQGSTGWGDLARQAIVIYDSVLVSSVASAQARTFLDEVSYWEKQAHLAPLWALHVLNAAGRADRRLRQVLSWCAAKPFERVRAVVACLESDVDDRIGAAFALSEQP